MSQALRAGPVTEVVVHSFGAKNQSAGFSPDASLIPFGGRLFGTTSEGGVHAAGTVFFITSADKQGVVYPFAGQPDGADPKFALINVGGTFYGTTSSGGSANFGTVFSVSPTGAEKVLHSFAGPRDGEYPEADLIDVNGTLYGTTQLGGAHSLGTFFSVALSGNERVLHSFHGKYDGAQPSGALVNVKGELYGTTFYGFKNNDGGVFGITTSGKVQPLYSFNGSPDGANPLGGLVNVNGTLFGTTSAGGSGPSDPCFTNGTSGCGTVFSIGTVGNEKILYSFSGPPDGATPMAVLADVNGTLYGTTFGGGSVCLKSGSSGCGTVFSITTSGAETIVYRFGGTPDGANPVASPVGVNGMLYGTTLNGGAYKGCRIPAGCGTVYSITL